jgi:hypothetical protein
MSEMGRGCVKTPNSNPDFLSSPPPSADIGPGGQSVGQAAQFCLVRLATRAAVGPPLSCLCPTMRVGDDGSSAQWC